jgi:hypothetical protein
MFKRHKSDDMEVQMKKAMVWMLAVGIMIGSVAMAQAVSAVNTATDEKGQVNSMQVSVPNVVGMLGGKGRQAIENAGLKWAYASQGIPTSDPNKNAIIANQSPGAAARVMRGSTVTLTLYIFVERAKPVGDGDEKGQVNLPRR